MNLKILTAKPATVATDKKWVDLNKKKMSAQKPSEPNGEKAVQATRIELQ